MRARFGTLPFNGATLTLGLWATACDWSEFDDLEARASVVRLDRAEESEGFGRSLAVAANDDAVLLLVGGTPSRSASAAYNIGREQTPSKSPTLNGFCSGDNAFLTQCKAAEGAAYFGIANSRDDVDLCFAYAWGQTSDANDDGILVRCFSDAADVTLRVPSSARSARRDAYELNEENQPLWLSSDRGGQWLLASLGAQNRAWYYVANETASPSPVTLSRPPGSGESFGSRNVVLRTAEGTDGRLFAVSAPDEGQVWLFRAGEESAVLTGCLGERPGFGRSLASGDVDEDGNDDLVVAEDDFVTVFSGAALAVLPESFSETCTLSALPAEAVLGSFGCGSRLSLAGCDDSDFGASVAVGDLDGDGDGEVIVGAPQMSTNGQANAGGVLIYDVEGTDRHELNGVLYLSSAEGDDLLGSSVAAVPQAGHDVVAAGGPGRSKVAVFYCSDLVDPEDRTGRCAR